METLLDIYKFYVTTPASLPMNIIVYCILLLACLACAFWRGGAPERIGATILAAGSLLSAAFFSGRETGFQSVELGILVVDLACSGAFILLALRADRYWLFWVAAFQINGTAGHLVRLLDRNIVPIGYAFLLAIWSYPIIFATIAGSLRHHGRCARFGSDRDWSVSG